MVVHAFVNLPNLFQIAPSQSPSSIPRATFHSLQCANCRAFTPVLPSVWKDLFPLLSLNTPHPTGFGLNVISGRGFPKPSPISIRCNFCDLNHSLYFLSQHRTQFIGIYLLMSIFFSVTSALHLSGNLTMIGILLRLLTGVPATSSTIPVKEQYGECRGLIGQGYIYSYAFPKFSQLPFCPFT